MANFRNVGLSVILGLAVLFSWFQPLDTAAISQVDAGLKRALASFAVARALNAVISVAQETQVSVQVGVGATFAPGQVLDPVNDLVEQFADLMLAASVAFGIMHVLIQIGSFWFFSLMLTVSAFAWMWLRWGTGSAPVWLLKFVIVLLFVRFSIPVVTVGSDLAFRHFMANDYSQSQIAIRSNSHEISQLEKSLAEKNADEATAAPSANAQQPASAASPQDVEQDTIDPSADEAQVTPQTEGGLWNKLKGTTKAMLGDSSEAAPTSGANAQQAESAVSRQDVEQEALEPTSNQAQETQQQQGGFWNKVKGATKSVLNAATGIPQALSNVKQNFETKIEKLKASADQLVEHMIKLMVIFILQTIIIPIGLLWLMYKLMFGVTRAMEKGAVSTS